MPIRSRIWRDNKGIRQDLAILDSGWYFGCGRAWMGFENDTGLTWALRSTQMAIYPTRPDSIYNLTREGYLPPWALPGPRVLMNCVFLWLVRILLVCQIPDRSKADKTKPRISAFMCLLSSSRREIWQVEYGWQEHEVQLLGFVSRPTRDVNRINRRHIPGWSLKEGGFSSDLSPSIWQTRTSWHAELPFD